MKLRMWTLDVAREQSPTYESLQDWCRLSLDSGYNALGLYLEHRFAYPSLPWASGKGALNAATVKRLQKEFPDLQIVPFVNLLGHFEGFLYTEAGAKYAEEPFAGMQANPLHPEFGKLCRTILDDTMRAFSSELVHIGGDETWQLGVGPASKARVAEAEADGANDGKAVLYGEHFGPLAQYVLDAGRRPGVWADMFDSHPDALALIPERTLLFDWRYFSGPKPPKSPHEKVYSPTIHVYDALWCHLPQSERNVLDHAAAAERDEAYGVCVTTWEFGLFANVNTLKPAIRASGEILNDVQERFAAIAVPSVTGKLEEDIPAGLESRRARAELSEELLKPYRTPDEDQPDPRSIRVTDPTLSPGEENIGSPIVRLVDAMIAMLIASCNPRGTFDPRDGEGRYDLLPGDGEVMTIPESLTGNTIRRFRILAGLLPHDLTAVGPGRITGETPDGPFSIELKSELVANLPKLSLEVIESPYVDRAMLPLAQRNVVRYAALRDAPRFLKAYLKESERSEEWARLMGCELQDAGGVFAFTGIRSAIKARLLLFSNPFLLYLRNGDDLFSESGEKAIAILTRAADFAAGPDERGPVQLGIKAIEFVRQCRRAHLAYAEGKPGEAINHLAPCRQIFEDLEKIAVANSINAEGSLADIERAKIAGRWVETVITRIKLYGDGSLGYLPSFTTITHPKFVPHDQANWWLINRWANE